MFHVKHTANQLSFCRLAQELAIFRHAAGQWGPLGVVSRPEVCLGGIDSPRSTALDVQRTGPGHRGANAPPRRRGPEPRALTHRQPSELPFLTELPVPTMHLCRATGTARRVIPRERDGLRA